MKTPDAAPAKADADALAADSLADVLHKSNKVGELIEECGAELAEVNAEMEQGLGSAAETPGARTVLESNQAVEKKIACAAQTIATVNDGLTTQIRNRGDLDERLASVTAREAKASHLALHDDLTGLPNRTLLHDRLTHGLAQARRHGWGMAVLFIDLNGFKQINDRHGHQIGDQLLAMIAQRMNDNIRSEDTIGRFGGDEFVYLLMEINSGRDVTPIVRKLIANLHAPVDIVEHKRSLAIAVRASVGIALFPKHGQNAEALLKKADKAMYRAKRQGLDYAYAR